MDTIIKQTNLFDYIVNEMDESLVLVDSNFKVRYMNSSAEQTLQFEGSRDSHFYENLPLENLIPQKFFRIVEEVFQYGIPRRKIIQQTRNGNFLSIHLIPLIEDGNKRGILLTAEDITEFMEMEHELDLAFALTLPNSKVEYKLKTLVEYQDRYDPDTGKITIKGIITDGGYRHVVNCLKLLSNLHSKGITKIIGIDKDLLVQAFVFHDLGKSQPILKIGDVVDPREVFENSKLHAFRGAEITQNFYSQHQDVVEIIRYHHHAEDELPESFPWRLKPMFRLFKLIDGLSAAMTRGDVKVHFELEDNVVIIVEENHRPQYNGTWLLNLYTGEKKRISSGDDSHSERGKNGL